MYLENKQNPNVRKCFCGRSKCNEISEEFRKIGDIRGDFCKIANPNDSLNNRKAYLKEKLQRWVRRLCLHHKIPANQFEQLCYNREKYNIVTRGGKNEQRMKDAYIAYHHYNPKLLEKYGRSVPRFEKVSIVKQLCLYDNGGGRSYSRADLIETDKSSGENLVALVPNYVDPQCLWSDLKEAKKDRELFVALKEAHEFKPQFRHKTVLTRIFPKEKEE